MSLVTSMLLLECWPVFRKHLLKAQEQVISVLKVKQAMQKASVTEQGTPLESQEEKEIVCSLEARSSFIEKLQSCSSHMQGEDMKD